METLISEIESVCKPYFPHSKFNLRRTRINEYVVDSDIMSTALNCIRNFNELINVISWFNEFWFYFHIKFILGDATDKIFISTSVFQGKIDDNIKTQLFRAEWDNFNGNTIHPQPHWHFYPVAIESKALEDFEEFMRLQKEEGFEDYMRTSPKPGLIDLRKIHFAMNGQWADGKTHIHQINEEKELLSWLSGLLKHIKEQLEYVT